MKKICKVCREVIVSEDENVYCCSKCEIKDYYLKNIYLSVLENIGNKDIQKKHRSKIKRIFNIKYITTSLNKYLNNVKKKVINNKYEKIHKI